MPVLATLLLSCCVTVLLTPIFRRVLTRYDIVDRPDSTRRFHSAPIPRAGGIPIAISFFFAFFIGSALLIPRGGNLQLLRQLAPGAAFMFLIGVADDLIGLTPWQKLAGQAAAAALVIYSGVRITLLHAHPAESWVNIPLTLLWLLACTNSLNLLDGLDGLATGVALTASLAIGAGAWLSKDVALLVAVAPFIGSLVAFLPYNFAPARIFLGDSGSLFIGFLLGCYGVLWSQKTGGLAGMAPPAILLSIPLLDTSFAIVRRLLCGRGVFEADRGHIHHKLIESGYSQRRAVLTLCGISAATGLLSLLHHALRLESMSVWIFDLCAAVALAVWYAVHCLGRLEPDEPDPPKRTLDAIVSFTGLVLLAPVIGIIALAVKWRSPGPVIYRGARVGRNGRLFKIYKFRSMLVNAEALGGSATANDDPRITRIGRFLRKYKLDELPQLVNVLKGDMSLVGPRPEVPKYVDQYSPEERQVLRLRPGITDWATIWNSDEGSALAGAEDPEKAYEELIRPTKTQLQLQYFRTRSMAVDLQILGHTLIKLIHKNWVPEHLTPYGRPGRTDMPAAVCRDRVAAGE